MNAAEHPLLAPLLAGDRRAIARAISAIENDAPGREGIAAAVATRLGRAHVVGITGAPGAGKSTLINALLGELLGRGRRVAVVAVDPSSPVTGGAVLGDRVRMGSHGAHENVFIRSIASRGHLGGVSRTTRQIVDVMDAAGFDAVIVETVGAGQSEVEIIEIADTRIVVCPPGLGDDVQAIKAGILEIADLLVVNKADLPAAETTVRELKEMLRLRAGDRAKVAVLKTSATRGEGIAALADATEAHAAAGGRGQRLRQRHSPSADDVAAVDRALVGGHFPHRFLARPVADETVEQILAVARQQPVGTPPWRVRALSGAAQRAPAPADATDRADSGAGRRPHRPGFDAPVVLAVSLNGSSTPEAWLECGRFVQRVEIAARARGLAVCVQALPAKIDPRLAHEFAVAAGETVVCAIALGYAGFETAQARPIAEAEPPEGFGTPIGVE